MWHCLSGHSRWFSKTLYGALGTSVGTGGLGVTCNPWRKTLCLEKPEAPSKATAATPNKGQGLKTAATIHPITTCNWEILGVSKMHSICSLFKAYLRMFSEDCTSQLYRCSITHKWTLFLCSNSLEIVCSSLADLQGPRTRIPCFVCKRSRTFSGMGNRVAKVCIERVAAQ